MIEELIRLVAPPAVPKNVPSVEEWELYEVALGCAFPSDYKQIINTYGNGWFANWIMLSPPKNIVDNLKPLGELLGMSMSRWEKPYTFYPRENGLMHCGIDDGNSFFTWKTLGPPDSWTLINFPNRPYEGSEAILKCNWLELLVGWFAGTVVNNPSDNEWYPEDVEPTQERFFRQS
ncbi:SMI1/KNR4 family protein [Armatimonas sp.]|uniref:SMI1/KNR4 family protein n=1 Tax=Armatimonas sp. TaxID=1872638 RepID=UPI0037535021